MKLKIALLFLAVLVIQAAEPFTVVLSVRDARACALMEQIIPWATPGSCRQNIMLTVVTGRDNDVVIGVTTSERSIIRQVPVELGRATIFVELLPGETYLAYSVSEVQH